MRTWNMRLGVDFGTTRIVAAAADRGNYPLISFESGDGAFDFQRTASRLEEMRSAAWLEQAKG